VCEDPFRVLSLHRVLVSGHLPPTNCLPADLLTHSIQRFRARELDIVLVGASLYHSSAETGPPYTPSVTTLCEACTALEVELRLWVVRGLWHEVWPPSKPAVDGLLLRFACGIF
jgi:hypothetical protein